MTKWGLIDSNGKMIVPFDYDDIGHFSEGLAMVGLDGKYGFIDKEGKEVIPCKYEWAGDFSDGLAWVKLDGKIGFVNKEGKEFIPCKYDGTGDFSEGLAAVELDGKWGFIDKEGKEVIPCKYDSARPFSDGLAVVGLDGKYGFIDKEGKEVIPCKYDDFGYFSDGLAWVILDGKIGFVNKEGKEAIPCKYDDAGYFSEGLARVKLAGKYGFIDKEGKEVIPCKYERAGDFSEGLAWVKLDGKYGFIDKEGKEVVPCKYDDACDFSDGLARVELTNEGTPEESPDFEAFMRTMALIQGFRSNNVESQIGQLHEMLEEAGIPHRYSGVQLVYYGAEGEPKREPGVFYGAGWGSVCSVIANGYGSEEGLLEISGLLTEEEYEKDSVAGYLTAQDVFERIKNHYESIIRINKGLLDEEKKCPICGHAMPPTEWHYHHIEDYIDVDERWGGFERIDKCGFCHHTERVVSQKVFRVGFDALKGKTFSRIEGLKKGSEGVAFHCADGTVYFMFHLQQCCESVWLEDVCGEADDLVGSEVLVAEENSSKNFTPVDFGETPAHRRSFTWTFYKIATRKGYVDLRWFGESNGYYSEKVFLNHIVDPDDPDINWID